MALKEDGKEWKIREQTLEDPVSGLTFQFEVVDDHNAPFRCRIFGRSLAFGRELSFDRAGKSIGPGWPTKSPEEDDGA